MAEDCDADLRERLTRLETALMGADGTNGKLGTLRADLEEVRLEAQSARRLLYKVGAALGGVLVALATVAVPMIISSSRDAAQARESLDKRVLVIETRLDLNGKGPRP